MKRKVVTFGIVLLLSLFSTAAFADPTIFSMELGVTTEDQLKSMYKVEHIGTNKYSDGNMYSIPTGEVSFDGLKELTVIFDTDGVLVAVLAKLPKSKFSYLNSILSEKYKRVSQNIPFVGNKSASYRDGSTEISLDAPHLSFDMSMNYLRDSLLRAFRQQSEAEKRQKQKGEAAQL